MASNALRQTLLDAGLLLLRAAAGGLMFFNHGLGKASRLLAGSTSFADPLGIGPVPSLVLAVLGEAVCSALVVLGVATRLTAVPVMITMLVAAFVVHADDPWSKKELALLFALPMATLVLTGPGRWSVDHLWLARRGRRAKLR